MLVIGNLKVEHVAAHTLSWTLLVAAAAPFYLLCLVLVHPCCRRTAARLLAAGSGGDQRLAPLEGIRGLSAMWVAVHHAVFFPSWHLFWTVGAALPFLAFPAGGKAVPIFAVISGLVIHRSVSRISDLADLRDYVRRRFLRIYPLFAVTAMLSMIFMIAPFPDGMINHVVAQLSLFPALGGHETFDPPSWSLQAEVVFYALAPFVGLLAARTQRVVLPVLLMVFFVSDISSGGNGWQPVLWKHFVLGMMASVWLASREGSDSEIEGIATFACGVVLLWANIAGVPGLSMVADLLSNSPLDSALSLVSPSRRGGHLDLGTGIAAFLIVVGACQSRIVGYFLCRTPVRVAGTISYSIYLVHPLVLMAILGLGLRWSEIDRNFLIGPVVSSAAQAPGWIVPVLILPACLFWSAVSFVLVERPFLLAARRWRVAKKIVAD